jgi:hypothetical protein
MECDVCGTDLPCSTRCLDCLQVGALVDEYGPDDQLALIVDGSFAEGRGGAGLVLVQGGVDGDFIAFAACRFRCRNSMQAELQAILRGSRWAPGVTIHSDLMAAIKVARKRHGIDVTWMPLDPVTKRGVNHSFAHRLSNEGRKSSGIDESSPAGEDSKPLPDIEKPDM